MPTEQDRRPDVLVVAGTGRSGTSLFTGLLGHLGHHIPKPEVAANQSNPRGFSEPRWLVDLHNELLERARVTIEDGRPEAWEATDAMREDATTRRLLGDWIGEQVSHGAPVAVKDPRLGWFLELHRDVVTSSGLQLRSVTMMRDLAEVMKSREIAYGTRSNSTTRVAGWLNMMLTVEQKTRDLPRAFVRYDGLLADWQGALRTAEVQLGAPLLTGATPEQVAAAEALVDPSLRRSVVDWDSMALPARTEDLARRSLDALFDLVEPADEVEEDRRLAHLDDLRAEFLDYYEESADFARGRVRVAREEERAKIRQERSERRERRAAAQRETPVTTAPGSPNLSLSQKARRKAAAVVKAVRS